MLELVRRGRIGRDGEVICVPVATACRVVAEKRRLESKDEDGPEASPKRLQFTISSSASGTVPGRQLIPKDEANG